MKFNLSQLMSEQSMKENDQHMVFKIEFLPIEQLKPSEMNKYVVDDVAELKASIELMGLQQNLLVRTAAAGGYEVISGHRRLKAMQELYADGNDEFKTVPCKVTKTADDIQAELQLLLANSTARELTDYEKTYQSMRLQELLEDLKQSGFKFTGRKREIVAELMGVSSSQIARMDSINKRLSPELKEKFSEGDINITTAYELSTLSKEVQKEMSEEQQITGGSITPAVVKKKKEQMKQQQAAAAEVQDRSTEEVVRHHLKIEPEPFEAIRNGLKLFEWRKEDRSYQVGDMLHLSEWDPVEEKYTKRSIQVKVIYMLAGGQYGIPKGYVVMSIKRSGVV